MISGAFTAPARMLVTLVLGARFVWGVGWGNTWTQEAFGVSFDGVDFEIVLLQSVDG
jgi:hypothetical protein